MLQHFAGALHVFHGFLLGMLLAPRKAGCTIVSFTDSAVSAPGGTARGSILLPSRQPFWAEPIRLSRLQVWQATRIPPLASTASHRCGRNCFRDENLRDGVGCQTTGPFFEWQFLNSALRNSTGIASKLSGLITAI
jgi:hypothetical protein